MVNARVLRQDSEEELLLFSCRHLQLLELKGARCPSKTAVTFKPTATSHPDTASNMLTELVETAVRKSFMGHCT